MEKTLSEIERWYEKDGVKAIEYVKALGAKYSAIPWYTVDEYHNNWDETIAKLQSEDVSLEESFELYKKGMDYVKICSETIDQVEKKVLMLNQEGKMDELGE